jgi:hypothetical protein
MTSINQGPNDDYRRTGQPVTYLTADGTRRVSGTVRWEDANGVKVDVPGQQFGAYVSHAFVTFTR